MSEADRSLEAARELRIRNEQNARIAELERQVTHLTGALAAADRENQLNRARLVQLRESMSWKVTSPIRRLRRAASRSGQ